MEYPLCSIGNTSSRVHFPLLGYFTGVCLKCGASSIIFIHHFPSMNHPGSLFLTNLPPYALFKPWIVGIWLYKFRVLPQGNPHFPFDSHHIIISYPLLFTSRSIHPAPKMNLQNVHQNNNGHERTCHLWGTVLPGCRISHMMLHGHIYIYISYIHWPDKSYASWVVLLQNPFPLESFCQHDSGQFPPRKSF